MQRRRGFTLIELLIVIGIIALLLSILLPAAGRVREQSRQLVCLNNLRQLGMAFTEYAHDNKDYFPAGSPYSVESPDDWIFWEPNRIAQIGHGGIGRYLNLTNTPMGLAVLRCPSDDLSYRARTGNNGYGPYPFSYSMNYYMTVNGTDVPMNIMLVRNPASKWILMEEDENTIDDGWCTPNPDSGINMLAIRHDGTRQNPDNTTTGLTLNGSCHGNVAFCDGHAEYMDRLTVHNQASYLPTY